MPSISFDDLAVVDPRFAQVARILENIRDHKAVNFSAECDRVIFEHLTNLLRETTQ